MLGPSAIEAGLVYVPGTLVMLVVSGATANRSERISPGILISAGLALVAAGMALMMASDVDSSWTVALPGSIVAMIGTGLFNPAVIAVALEAVPGERSGLAAGVNDTFRQAGIAVGVAALGALSPPRRRSAAAAALRPGTSRASGTRSAGAGLAALGAVVTAVLLRSRRPRPAVAGKLAADAA